MTVFPSATSPVYRYLIRASFFAIFSLIITSLALSRDISEAFHIKDRANIENLIKDLMKPLVDENKFIIIVQVEYDEFYNENVEIREKFFGLEILIDHSVAEDIVSNLKRKLRSVFKINGKERQLNVSRIKILNEELNPVSVDLKQKNEKERLKKLAKEDELRKLVGKDDELREAQIALERAIREKEKQSLKRKKKKNVVRKAEGILDFLKTFFL